RQTAGVGESGDELDERPGPRLSRAQITGVLAEDPPHGQGDTFEAGTVRRLSATSEPVTTMCDSPPHPCQALRRCRTSVTISPTSRPRSLSPLGMPWPRS